LHRGELAAEPVEIFLPHAGPVLPRALLKTVSASGFLTIELIAFSFNSALLIMPSTPLLVESFFCAIVVMDMTSKTTHKTKNSLITTQN
ncbi:MAG: hypothetical protein RLN96_00345, partial [Pseudomonadales bacterium]